MKKFFPLLSLIIFCIACSNTSENTPSDADINSALALKNNGGREYDSLQLTLVGTFEGTIPCADCGGIKTELILYQDIANAENNTYTLSETYLGGKLGDTTFTSNGKWDILKGMKGDDTATVYFLNYDEPDDSRYFLKKGDAAIIMLDKDQQLIESPLNYTLHRK
ncbi:MAG: copper resistance protein NlpE N-terminal domain-containing protein [Chitinophagaceae bacterium]|nr:copper resistance protein NlpE N-terminal domain-containing protein [Chitinophagaceae bacterium]